MKIIAFYRNVFLKNRTKVFLAIILCVLICNSSLAQIVNLPCQDQTQFAEIGLDRKNWNGGNTAFHSQGALHNFELPQNTFGDCKRISNVSVDLTVINIDVSNLPPDCPAPVEYYINIATGCPSTAPASCAPSNFIYEAPQIPLSNLSLSFNDPPENFSFGENLSYDIVPVMNTGCSEGQTALSSGSIILEYEICVTVTIIDEVIDVQPELGPGITICPNTTTTLDPGSYTSYMWGPNGETTPTIDVGQGPYFVTVTDANGCTGIDNIIVTSHPTSPITFDPVAPTVCDDGFVDVSVNETYTSYTWSNGLSGQTVSLSTGTYQVTITDSNNCTFENSISVTSVAPPNAGIDNFLDVCNDGSTYNIEALLLTHDAGGTWIDTDLSGVDINSSPMNVSFIGVTPGTYDFTYSVTGDAPCPPEEATISIQVFEQFSAGTSTTEQFCPDPGNLDFNLFLNNPDGGGSWVDVNSAGVNLSNPFSVDFDGVPIGNYDFEYTHDAIGPCAAQSTTLTIVILAGDSAGEDNAATVCEGAQFNLETLIDGASTTGIFFDSGGSGALSGSIVNTTGLAGSTFDFTFIVGAAGGPCGEDEAIFTLTIESSLSAGIGQSDSTCIGSDINLFDFLTDEDQGGSFTDANSSGGLSGNILTTDNISPGIYNYTYQIGDGVTCPISTSTIELTFFDEPTASFDQDELTICESLCTLVEINLSGQPPFSFSLEVYSSTTNNLLLSGNLTSATNNYTLTACNAIDSLTLINDTISLLSDSTWYIHIPSISDMNCEVNPIGTPDSIIINTASTTLVQIDTSACITDTLVIDGIMLFDGNAEYRDTLAGVQCDSIIHINVTFSDADSIFIEPTLCAGDSILIRGNWYNGDNPSDLITVTNPNGCDSLFVIDVSFYPEATNTIDDQLCSGDSIVVNNTVYNELMPSGIETLENQAANGCDSTIIIALQYLGDITQMIDDTLCQGGSIIVGTETFNAANPSGQVTLAGTGCDTIVNVNLSFHPESSNTIDGIYCRDYSIVVNNIIYDVDNANGTETLANQSQFGCDSIVIIDLDFYPESTGSLVGPFCEDFSIVINSTTYDINNQTGTEILTGASQFGCDSIVEIDLDLGTIDITQFTTEICESDSLEINGTMYSANNTMGTEIFIGGSVSGCDSTVEVELTILPAFEISLQEMRCAGDSIFAEGAWQFDAGIYTDIFQTVDLCDSIVMTELTLTNCQTTVVLDMTDNACAGGENGSITLNIETGVSVPFTITWDGATTGTSGSQVINTSQNIITIPDLISDNYTIRILDSDGINIYESTAMVIDLNQPISGTWEILDSILCTDDLGTIEFQTTGGQGPYEYDWSDSNIGDTEIAQSIMPGDYILTITDALGCIFETGFTLDNVELFTASISSLSPTCLESSDGEIEITDISGGTLPYTISLNGTVTPDLIFSSLDTGSYIIEVIDANNCMVSFSEELVVDANPMLGDYTLEYTITEGDSIVLAGSTSGGNYTFEWEDNPQSLSCTDCANPIAAPTDGTVYNLTITDENGCQEMISILVNVNEIVVENILPNVFSPNGDNSNDEFIFINFNDDILDIQMIIYDRWGNKVFQNQSSDNSIAWDGTKNGKNLDSGVYVYSLMITKSDGEVERKFGDVLLIR